MKRVILFVLCFVLMAPCAWAGDLSAVYTHDGTKVEKIASKLQIEAMRDVKFIYAPSTYDTAESYTIAFTNGVSMDMTSADGSFYCLYSFDASLAETEIGISMDATGFTPCSADITEAWPFELDPVELTMTTNQSNAPVHIIGDYNVSNWEVKPTVLPLVVAQAQQDTINPNRIWVSSLTSVERATLTVKFTHKTNGKSFERKCFITVTNGDSGSGGGSSGGGGCNAGLAGLGLGLLALLPFAARKKR